MQIQKAKLIERKNLTENIFELKFSSEKTLNFTPGQFINIKIEDAKNFPCFRAYSISSMIDEKTFELCIKIIPNGRGSNWLKNIELNSEINFLGPYGKLIFKNNNSSHIFIATSVGVAPFKSIIEHELNNNSKNNIELIMGVRFEKDIFYMNEFNSLADSNSNFKFTLTISRPEKLWKGAKGRVNKHIKINKNTQYYVCGSKAVVNDVVRWIKEKGIPEEQINFENFG
ncbi:hypothetical protein GF354_00795 [Candidatus Peregrinibacteria bacterium]|nr:hypothetical protein [Candidatus Peregrinibacteria bacterium]